MLRTIEVRGSATGLGQVRTGNAIGRVDLQVTPGGTSALRAIERLPGVNMQGADPFGLYEWATRVTMRGFQSPQVGQTFDGITLGDMSYGNFNGLNIGRAVDSDNLVTATVTQGTGALGTASSNNLGGVVQYLSDDPANERRFTFRQMLGQASTRRTSGRFDTGLLQGGSNAFKALLSFSRYDTDKWKGSGARYSPDKSGILGERGLFGDPGEQWMDQLNGKAQYLFGGHRITAFYNFADKRESDYVDMTLGRYRTLGREYDHFADWTAAKAQATTAGQEDLAYFHSSQGARRDHFGYLSADFQLGQSGQLTIKPYAHTNEGAGDWHAPNYGSTAFSPDPIYFRQTQYDNNRQGVILQARGRVGPNALEGGAWFERNESNIRRVAWRMTNYAASPDVNFNNVLRLFFDRTGDLSTRTLYAQNTNTFLDERFKLTYGAKYLYIDADFRNNGRTIASAQSAPDTARPSVSIPTDGGILPQAGAVFAPNERVQFFANYSQNVNAYPYSPQSGVYNTAASTFQFFNDNAKPEKAHTYELGVRTRTARVDASAAVYAVDYRNRLIGVAVCPLTATCASSFANVGSVSTSGVEGLLALRVADGLTWSNAASFNRSTIDDDYSNGTTRVASSGKKVVDAPEVLLNSSLRLARGGFTGSVAARHVGKRYFSILNDMSVPSYTTADLSAAYALGAMRGLKGLSLQLNVLNLFDESFISSVGTGGFSVTGDLETLMVGQKRLVFLGLTTSF
ncbi:MAG: TonB-dependent receptor [Cytophagaceae bacterium]|nr:TonB-dependent receptor [Gemmatimonadaceae bacterium]